jgi:hypothetical protein
MQVPDHEATGGVYLQAKVDGRTVSVLVSAEAKADYGLDACRSKAEEKIEQSPGVTRITLQTSDFR